MMYFKLIPTADGEFADSAGKRFSISAVRRIRTVEGINTGYLAFESLEAALEYWNLVAVETEVLP